MLETCRICKGEGKVYSKEWGIWHQCLTCKGKGKIKVPAGKKICSKCNGSGFGPRQMMGRRISFEPECKECNATGLVDI